MSTVVQMRDVDFTPAQKREIAIKYAGLNKGRKGQYAKSLGLAPGRIRSWIAALADGDIESGVAVRKTGTMTDRDVHVITRLHDQLESQKARHATELADAQVQYASALAERDGKIETLEKAADALGKAITVVHNLGDPPAGEEKR
ncbi:hypothetical protein [Corynebacterium cystitidis]|uniref:Transposase n=1 Tax=Corynebacterium cystitidis DSM 20524 TaxID=1121357 RepID=A0A1H9T4Z8_9CORY|nr:hypothetical protein [Corynebacterium cystitidis]WJY83460.1 hypothetical protein CCYS_12875 [Corynebacterium cystitidis DSM 20524]SER92238.1 hypothetical protein SAMN05661109_01317 [Corynebacterium cystitidis DSM 20524]SNV61230.1 Uncharacterised protein [Corynebacterium cystitidis]